MVHSLGGGVWFLRRTACDWVRAEQAAEDEDVGLFVELAHVLPPSGLSDSDCAPCGFLEDGGRVVLAADEGCFVKSDDAELVERVLVFAGILDIEGESDGGHS